MGTDNMLVGFHLNWLRTAVKLKVPASRVIELGLEQAAVPTSPTRRRGRQSLTRADTPPTGSGGANKSESLSRRTRSQQRSSKAVAVSMTPK